MNRIILIGNGFDLAHGLKTSYNDFIDWVFNEEMKIFSENYDKYDSKLIKINARSTIRINGSPDLYFYENLGNLINHNIIKKEWLDQGLEGFNNVEKKLSKISSTFVIKNKFLEEIVKPNKDRNWFEIEDSYYDILINYVINKGSNTNDPGIIKERVSQLHRDFEQVKDLLEEYLCKQDTVSKKLSLNKKIQKQIYSKIRLKELKSYFHHDRVNILKSIFEKHLNDSTNDFYDPTEDFRDILNTHSLFYEINKHNYQYKISELLEEVDDYDIIPDNILLLSFNYTSTSSQYLSSNFNSNITEIHIHGKLRNEVNPIIFGYGDEIDESYSELENLNDNEYLKNIKSIQYSNTNNYKRLLNYLNADQYQVFIYGHSCGLSDRTMLNTIFEHENCVSIKPYFYVDKNGINYYSDTVMNISRHFNNKASMRDLVVDKTNCEAMPQIKSKEE